MTDWTQDHKDRFRKASQIAENNPETLFVDAAKNGDDKTVRFMLDHDINITASDAKDTYYIALPPKAYQHAFAAAMQDFHSDVIMEILDMASDKIDWSALAHAAYSAMQADVKKYPDAADIVDSILITSKDALPYPVQQVAIRFNKADEEQKQNIRDNLDAYVTFYDNKQFYTERAENRSHGPEPLARAQNNGTETKAKKERPSYLRPV